MRPWPDAAHTDRLMTVPAMMMTSGGSQPATPIPGSTAAAASTPEPRSRTVSAVCSHVLRLLLLKFIPLPAVAGTDAYDLQPQNYQVCCYESSREPARRCDGPPECDLSCDPERVTVIRR